MTGQNLNSQQLAALRRLADLFIPASKEMPCATEVDVDGRQTQLVLAVRPDLLPGLQRAITTAEAAVTLPEVSALLADDHEALHALTTVIAGAYYTDASVRTLIGYPGQEARPTDPPGTPTYLSEGLLEKVLERGEIFRSV